MNELTSFESNLFEKYKTYKSNDTSHTNTNELDDEQRELVNKALNSTFVNPKFKMKHFVTSGQLTPFSTLKQYIIELKTIEEACETFEHNLEKFRIEKEILEIKLQRADDELVKKELQLVMSTNVHTQTQNKRRLQQYYIEREQYIELIQEFLESPDGKTVDGKSLMDVFGTPEEDVYEQNYWTIRLAKQAAMDISSYGRVSAGNLDAITQMPDYQQTDTLALAHEYSLKIDNLSNAIRNDMHSMLLQHDSKYAERAGLLSNLDSQPEGKKSSDDSDPQEFLDVYRT